MRSVGEALSRVVRRAADLAETRWSVGVVFAAALAVWWLEALVIPLGPGRDLGTYVGGYIQLFQAHPIDLGYVLGRTPISMLVVGGLLDLAHGALAEPVMSLLYAGSIVAWFLAARTFGGRVAVFTALALLIFPSYGILFHELSSDAVFAAVFAGWGLLLVRVLSSPSARGFAAVGAGVGVLVLVRPGNQILLLLVVLPLLVHSAWRARLVSAAAFLVPAVVLIAGWAVHNGIRYDNYTIARGGNATVPFYRTFVTDKIVEPSNGSASRELAAAVQRDLIPQQPYRAYGITLDDFFKEASPRMQVDLLALTDKVKGWHSNYRWLRDVGVEAVEAHPARYARGVLGSVWGMLRQGVYRNLPSSSGGSSSGSGTSATIVVNGRTLPTPTEGEPIPAAHEGGVTTPDFSIYTVWTSPSSHHLVFVHPGAEQRYIDLHRRMAELSRNLPDRGTRTGLALRLNQASRWFPPAVLWLAVGLIALAFRRVRGTPALWVPTFAGLLVIVLTALGLPAEPHYSIPVAPAFLLFGIGGLLAPRAALVPVGRWRTAAPRLARSAAPWLAAGAGIAAMAWAVTIYGSKLHDAFAADQAPHDLDVFLRAATNVLHGASPYVFRGDETYAYPPLLAFLAVPLHPLGAAAATLVWMLVGLAAIAASLWFLGVRDWRCYGLAAAYPLARSAVGLGTIAPLLLLAVAAAWHWRDRLFEPALSVGGAVALKLFLWPVAVWLALTQRLRPAVGAVVAAAALTLVPWAVIAFAGITHYPGLLHRLADDEASSSYSVIALAVRAHLPQTVGVVLSVLIALALLMAAAIAARARTLSTRDRDVVVLTLALAAALAASPIVWVHYFLLLLVPLALTRPRLSPLWFVPFAYYPLGETAWPAGDATKLALGLGTTLVLLLAALRTRTEQVPAAPAAPRPASVPAAPMRLTRAR